MTWITIELKPLTEEELKEFEAIRPKIEKRYRCGKCGNITAEVPENCKKCGAILTPF